MLGLVISPSANVVNFYPGLVCNIPEKYRNAEKTKGNIRVGTEKIHCHHDLIMPLLKQYNNMYMLLSNFESKPWLLEDNNFNFFDLKGKIKRLPLRIYDADNTFNQLEGSFDPKPSLVPAHSREKNGILVHFRGSAGFGTNVKAYVNPNYIIKKSNFEFRKSMSKTQELLLVLKDTDYFCFTMQFPNSALESYKCTFIDGRLEVKKIWKVTSYYDVRDIKKVELAHNINVARFIKNAEQIDDERYQYLVKKVSEIF